MADRCPMRRLWLLSSNGLGLGNFCLPGFYEKICTTYWDCKRLQHTSWLRGVRITAFGAFLGRPRELRTRHNMAHDIGGFKAMG